MPVCQTERNACKTLPDMGNNADTMGSPLPNRSKETLSVSRGLKHTHRNRHHETELQVSKRAQFRASDVMAHALNQDTTHTVSQTWRFASSCPRSNIARAEQLLRTERTNQHE